MKVLLVAAVLSFFQLSSGFLGFTNKYNSHAEPELSFSPRAHKPHRKTTVEKYMTMPLDHFDPQRQDSWQMRYFENDVHYQPGGPILIYVGGEWQISSGSLNEGSHIYDIAQEYNGTLFYTEHRFYGESHPTNSSSSENMQFLSVDQALADLAHFIIQIKKSSSDLSTSGVILVGASYSATMAAWMRLKYPHLVNGAWASSAPLVAKLDFYEYKEVMTSAIERLGGEECKSIFENAFLQLEEKIAQGDTLTLYRTFTICTPLDLSVDAAHMLYELSDFVAGLVQGHRNSDIEVACRVMKREKDEKNVTDLKAFGTWVKRGSLPCIDLSYNNLLKKLSDAEWGSEGNKQMRQWTYQVCSEFAWFQTSTSTEQIFGTLYPLDYFIKICEDLFQKKFNLNSIEQSIKRTNIFYGGVKPSLTNVYFTHGDIDPWHPMGLLEDLNPSTLVRILPNQAHVSDLGRITEADSPEKIESKRKVMELVGQWLQDRD